MSDNQVPAAFPTRYDIERIINQVEVFRGGALSQAEERKLRQIIDDILRGAAVQDEQFVSPFDGQAAVDNEAVRRQLDPERLAKVLGKPEDPYRITLDDLKASPWWDADIEFDGDPRVERVRMAVLDILRRRGVDVRTMIVDPNPTALDPEDNTISFRWTVRRNPSRFELGSSIATLVANPLAFTAGLGRLDLDKEVEIIFPRTPEGAGAAPDDISEFLPDVAEKYFTETVLAKKLEDILAQATVDPTEIAQDPGSAVDPAERNRRSRLPSMAQKIADELTIAYRKRRLRGEVELPGDDPLSAVTSIQKVAGRNPKLAGMLLDEYRSSIKEESGPVFDPEEVRSQFDIGLPPAPGDTGGRVGRVRPLYRPPDERVVRDLAKSRLRVLIGDAPEPYVEAAVKVFMRDHRRAFDQPASGVDPAQSLKEYIRTLPEYQRIHAARPETVEEDAWLPRFFREVIQAGAAPSQEQVLATDFAKAGFSLEQAQRGTAVREFARLGQNQGFLGQMRRAIRNVVGVVG